MKKILTIILTVFIMFGCNDTTEINMLGDLFSEKTGSLEDFKGTEGIYAPSKVGGADIVVTKGSELNKVNITWEVVEGASAYVIYRAEATPVFNSLGQTTSFKNPETYSFIKLAEIEGDKTSFDDTTLDLQKGYCYSLKTIKTIDEQKYEGKASYSKVGWAFSIPEKIFATDKESKDYINVTWQAVPSATKYEIWRAEAPLKDGEGNPITPKPEAPTSDYQKIGESFIPQFQDLNKNLNGPKSTHRYFYKITAKNKYLTTDYEECVLFYGEVLAPGTALPPKSVVVSRALTGKNEVSWTKSGGAAQYVVYRSDKPIEEAIAEATLETLGRTSSLSYMDEGLEPGKSYWYSVSAINDSGDEGKKSLDFAIDNAPDEEGCSYTNQGYPIATPKAELLYMGTSEATTYAYLSWEKVPGAEKYIVKKNGEEVESEITELGYVINDLSINDLSTISYSIIAINVSDGNIENESEESEEATEKIFEFSGEGGTFTGEGENAIGSVTLDFNIFKNFGENFFEAASLKKTDILKTNSSDVTFDISNFNSGSFIDEEGFSDFVYADLTNALINLNPIEGKTNDEVLKDALSVEYELTLTKEGAEYTAKARSWRLLSLREAIMVTKIGDNCGANKITNQIGHIHGAPEKLGGNILGIAYYPEGTETDQGYYEGFLQFNVIKEPTGSKRWIEISFDFYGLSDIPGLRIYGSNFVNQSQDDNFLNKTGGSIQAPEPTPTLYSTIFSDIKVIIQERAILTTGDNVVTGGYMEAILEYKGEELYRHTFSDEVFVNFFVDGGLLRPVVLYCPGGRNHTRGSEVSSGHYTGGGNQWVDPVDCGPRARLQSGDNGSWDVLADQDK